MKHYQTNGTVRPTADSWDGPHFRLAQGGIEYVETARSPHAFFMDAMEAEGSWIYVLSGHLYYGIGNDRHRVDAGKALITRRPDPGWLLRPADGMPLYTVWLHVSGEPAMRMFDFLHLKYGQIQHLPLDCQAVQLARSLIRQVAAHPKRPAHLRTEKTFQWLNAWWQCAQENYRPREKVLLEALKPTRLISFAPQTIKNFAVEMGYSRSYLTRKLTQQWSDSPGKILRRVRLEEAARLLRTTRLNLQEISTKVGYSTTASFSRAFVQQYKQPPIAYRHDHS